MGIPEDVSIERRAVGGDQDSAKLGLGKLAQCAFIKPLAPLYLSNQSLEGAALARQGARIRAAGKQGFLQPDRAAPVDRRIEHVSLVPLPANAAIDGEGGQRLCVDRPLLRPSVCVLEAHDIVLAEVAPGLHLDDLERDFAGVREAVRLAKRDVRALILG